MSAERALGHINFLLDILDTADRGTGSKAAPVVASGGSWTAFKSCDECREGQTVRVCSNMTLLQTEWEECGLGSHNELAAFLNQVGKITEVEEDDDTLQLTWENYDTCWMPLRACGDANGAKATLPGMANSWLGGGDAKQAETPANQANEKLFTSAEDDGVEVGVTVQVTRNKDILTRTWVEAELGENDTMDTYCGTIGKIVEIEEDDDTVKLQWANFDTAWIPIKACLDANGAKETLPGMTVSWLG